jgi:uncharacterized protein YggE
MTFASNLPGFPFVFVAGHASKEIPPDLATLTFEVKAFDEDPKKSLEIVQKQTTELLGFFKKLQIQDKDIESYQIDKQAIRQQEDTVELKILGYETKQRIQVKLRDLKVYPALAEGLLTYRNVTDIQSKFDISQRKEVEKSLVAEACADARVQAENMANGMGVKLGSVFAISDKQLELVWVGQGEAVFKRSMYGGEESQGLVFIPTSIKVEKKIDVIFKLAE